MVQRVTQDGATRLTDGADVRVTEDHAGGPERLSGREPLQLVEIHQDFCSRVYGVAPCVARLEFEPFAYVFDGELPEGVTVEQPTVDFDGSYVDPNGVIQYAGGPDDPRWTHVWDDAAGNWQLAGLLNEPEETNIVPRSARIGPSPWDGNAVVTSNIATAPDGSVEADLLDDSVTTATRSRNLDITVAGDTTVYRSRVRIKKAASVTAYPAVGIYFISGSTTVRSGVIVDPINGTLLTATNFPSPTGNSNIAPLGSEIVDVGDYWQVSLWAANQGAGFTTVRSMLWPAFRGDLSGTSFANVATGSVTFWGHEIRASAQAGSYIPTDAVPVTRAAGVVSCSHPAGGDLPDGLYDIVIERYGEPNEVLAGVAVAGGTYVVPVSVAPLVAVTLTPRFVRPDAAGTRKCYNTRVTCQDPENYDPNELVLRFARPTRSLPKDLLVIPSVVEVTTAPTRLNIGGGNTSVGPLGSRAVATVTLRDHPSPDRQVDKYVAERGFDPLARGTFWTKWLARNPYHQNRRLVIRSGYVGQTLEEMVRRDYLIDRIEGPSADGTVRMIAKDALKLAEDERAQAPALSPGELTAAIDESVTAFSVTPASLDDYPETGTLRIGREVMTYAGRSGAAGVVTFSGVVRATDGTAATAHQASERVQMCLRFTSEPVAALLHALLTVYGNVPVALIDLEAWQDEATRWLQGFELSALIAEPSGVTKLIAEIVEQVPLVVWWDERERRIRLRADRRSESSPPLIDERDHIVAGSMAVREDSAQRASQVWVYWTLRDPTGSPSEEANYSRIRIRADLEAEGADQYGEQRIRKVFARWLATEAQATVLSRRLLQRYGRNPRFLSLSLDARDQEIWTASFVTAATRLVTDDTGEPLPELYQVLSSEETVHGHTVEYELEKAAFEAGVRAGFWMANEAPNFGEANQEQRERGMFWAGEDGRLGDGSNGYGWQ